MSKIINFDSTNSPEFLNSIVVISPGWNSLTDAALTDALDAALGTTLTGAALTDALDAALDESSSSPDNLFIFSLTRFCSLFFTTSSSL